MRLLFIVLCFLAISTNAFSNTVTDINQKLSEVEAIIHIKKSKALELITLINEHDVTSAYDLFRFHTLRGMSYLNADKYPLSQIEIDKSTALLKKNDFPSDSYLALYYNLKADYANFSEDNHPLKDYQKSLEIYTKENNSMGKFTLYLNLSYHYMNQSRFVLAHGFAQRGFELAKKINEPTFEASINEIMGNIYTYMEKNEDALKYRTKAMNTYKFLNKHTAYLIAKSSVAGSMIDLKRHYQAQTLLKEIINDKESNVYDLYYSYQMIGESYYEEGKYKQATISLDKAMEYAENIIPNSGVVRNYIFQMAAYTKHKNMQKAEELMDILDSEDFITDSYHNNRNLFRLEKEKSYYYQSKGDYEKSLEHHKKYVELWQKFKNESSSNLINELKIKHDTDVAESEYTKLVHQNEMSNLKLKQVNKNTNYYIALIAFGSIAIIVISLVLLYQVKFKKKLLNMLKTDPLTQIYNRSYIMRKGESLYSNKNNRRSINSVLLFDLDNFKSINDNYGHHIGDEVLKVIANTASASVREQDTCARFGGEEFVIILPYTTRDQAELIAERVRESIEALTWEKCNINRPITVSIGSTSLSNQEDDGFNKALILADKAMYKAKKTGKNKVYSI